MPRTCTICNHKERAKIEAALVDGASFRHIASQFRVGYKSVERHKENCLTTTLAKATEAREIVQGDNLLAELKRHALRLHLLSDACHEWLLDPANPTRYTLEPRSSEVNVIYFKQDGVKRERKKEKLSALLREVETGLGLGVEIERGEYKHADPRELVLKTYDRIQGQIELVAKLIGELNDAPTVNFNVSLDKLQSLIIKALARFPAAKIAVSKALMEAKL